MLKQPLFGQDSSPHITSMLLSAIFTLVAWIIFCVMCLVIKFKPQVPEYKEVQIVLSSTPVVEENKSEESAAAQASAPAEELALTEPVEAPELPKPVETPVAEAPKENPAPSKPKTTPKAAQQPKKEYAKVKEPETYGTFLGDEIDFGTKKNSVSDKDWDSMFNDNPVSSSENNNPKKVNAASGYSGNQGTVDNNPEVKLRSDNNNNKDADAKGSLKDEDIDRIRKAVVAKGSGTHGVQTSLSSDTSSSDSKTIKMSDGSTRKIIKSSSINLSDEASKTIDFDQMTVKITFKVLPNGNVLLSSIKIDKAIFLEDIVVQEINNQIKQWILAPADSEAIAVFDLTIEKR